MIITCEHGGNQIPPAFQHLFAGQEAVLTSHRGWDPGALPVATFLSAQLQEPLFYMEISRLLIEMNRSAHHPNLYSEFSKTLDEADKQLLLNQYYGPYREKVIHQISKEIAGKKKALHISVHTFTPVLNNKVRKTDIGLLFDPDRKEEARFCNRWKAELDTQLPQFDTRFNYPYLGTDDGFTTFLRTQFPGDQYLGIEIEINQKYINQPEMEEIRQALAASLDVLWA